MVSWNEVKELIENVCSDPDFEIELETKIMDDLKFDSVAVMELFSAIEEQFGVDFTDLDDFEDRYNKCRDLYEGIVELLGKK